MAGEAQCMGICRCISIYGVLDKIGADINVDYWLGFWGEPRLIYTAHEFRTGKYNNSNRRSIHLGIDIFTNSGHKISAPLHGIVRTVENRKSHLDYGGIVILEHSNNHGDKFYSLYGHLNPSVVDELSVGQIIEKGEVFCEDCHIPLHELLFSLYCLTKLEVCIEKHTKNNMVFLIACT